MARNAFHDRQGNMGQGNVGMARNLRFGASQRTLGSSWGCWWFRFFEWMSDTGMTQNVKQSQSPKNWLNITWDWMPFVLTKRGGNDHLLERFTTVILPKSCKNQTSPTWIHFTFFGIHLSSPLTTETGMGAMPKFGAQVVPMMVPAGQFPQGFMPQVWDRVGVECWIM